MGAFRVFAVLLVVLSVALTIACGFDSESAFDESEAEVLPSYEDTEGVDQIGEGATVCGDVHGITPRPGQDTYLSFGKTYPNQVFAVIIADDDRSSFPADLQNAYGDRKVCVSGLIEGKGRSAEMTGRVSAQIVLQP